MREVAVNEEKEIRRIAIVGFGLVGASIAHAAKMAIPGVYIVAVDSDENCIERALRLAIADEAYLPSSPRIREFVMDSCDLLILATPIDAIASYLADIASWGYRGILSDVASSKHQLIKLAAEVLPFPHLFIPGHPMCGSEMSGIDSARPDLFKGAHWILCPDEDTNPDAFSALARFVRALGARVVSLLREEHDAALAVVSHVPHLVASSLVQLASRHADEQASLLRLAAGGFRDTTRVASGSPELWCGIAFDNRDALVGGLVEMTDIINSFVSALVEDDRRAFTALLEQSAAVRNSLPALWVPGSDKLLELRIPMENRSGVIAEVTTVISSAACNIYSIEIDHVTEDSAILNLLLTDEGDIGKLSSELIKAGYTVSFRPIG